MRRPALLLLALAHGASGVARLRRVSSTRQQRKAEAIAVRALADAALAIRDDGDFSPLEARVPLDDWLGA